MQFEVRLLYIKDFFDRDQSIGSLINPMSNSMSDDVLLVDSNRVECNSNGGEVCLDSKMGEKVFLVFKWFAAPRSTANSSFLSSLGFACSSKKVVNIHFETTAYGCRHMLREDSASSSSTQVNDLIQEHPAFDGIEDDLAGLFSLVS